MVEGHWQKTCSLSWRLTYTRFDQGRPPSVQACSSGTGRARWHWCSGDVLALPSSLLPGGRVPCSPLLSLLPMEHPMESIQLKNPAESCSPPSVTSVFCCQWPTVQWQLPTPGARWHQHHQHSCALLGQPPTGQQAPRALVSSQASGRQSTASLCILEENVHHV